MDGGDVTNENEPEIVTVASNMAKLYAEHLRVQAVISEHTKYDKDIKRRLLLAAGHDPDDKTPPSVRAVDADGRAVFEIAVTYKRGIDLERLKTMHPAAYADCERDSPVRSLKPPTLKAPRPE
jgi:hypothetical protein